MATEIIGFLLLMPIIMVGATMVLADYNEHAQEWQQESDSLSRKRAEGMKNLSEAWSNHISTLYPPEVAGKICIIWPKKSEEWCRNTPNGITPKPGCVLDTAGWEWCQRE